ncbi:uncharacterized protein MEPE_01064 [Melanopsichium pennsylvanicum]|uniref:SANT domain-containing protein n=2 Tax=Melanopsichium pennsylvanicum TaxID=63383 RepID=A0AAJ4XJN4_9BASI|nr:potential set3 histone deacetylase complex component snt1p [Melanopsichium pennsylvanicum 4]SNX82358.1 uncharacterized protein MEPE_01064 [Melanopsichium pennsylvanicum]
MDAKDSRLASHNSANAASPTNTSHPVAATGTGRSTRQGASMTDPRRNADDDDEEEEGMLKVDEEGQIEDDGTDHKVSHSRPATEGRSVPLADRLMPLSGSPPKKGGNGASSGSANSGYVSPRHATLDRERDRDRYLETSPGPSSYTPQRSRFAYPAESGSSYGSSSTYPYPSSHRETLRPEPFAPASRSSFSSSAPRGENRRGWYSPAATPRGPDTYRPGSSRDRERERDRDWGSFRDGDREREWSDLDRERDRDGYRDMVDKRRDWPPRERGPAASNYGVADQHTPYPSTANTKYGFDNRDRDFQGRRPASPPAHLNRDREFETDRSRDRERDRANDRDQRNRAPSSGWTSGMRQWGKSSDIGWDSRSSRRPASDDARSDTSHRPSGPRSNNSPPPATSSEAGGKPSSSDHASERSEARSRDMSPQPTRSPEHDGVADNAKGGADGKQIHAKGEGRKSAQTEAGSVDKIQRANACVEQEETKEETKEASQADAQTAEAKPDGANRIATPVPTGLGTAEGKEAESDPAQQAPETVVAPKSTTAIDAPTAEKAKASGRADGDAQEIAEPSQATLAAPTMEATNNEASSKLDPGPPPEESAALRASSPGGVKTESLLEITLESLAEEKEGVESFTADSKKESITNDAEDQQKVKKAFESQGPATLSETVLDKEADQETATESAPYTTAPDPSSAEIQPSASDLADAFMQEKGLEATQTTDQVDQAAEIAAIQPATSFREADKPEPIAEIPNIVKAGAIPKEASVFGEGTSVPPNASSPVPAAAGTSDGSESSDEVMPAPESSKDTIADVEMPDEVANQQPLPQEPAKAETRGPESLASSTTTILSMEVDKQSEAHVKTIAHADSVDAEPNGKVELMPDASVETEPVPTKPKYSSDGSVGTEQPQEFARICQAGEAKGRQDEKDLTISAEAVFAPEAAPQPSESVYIQSAEANTAEVARAKAAAEEFESQSTEATFKPEETPAAAIRNEEAKDGAFESKRIDEAMEVDRPEKESEPISIALTTDPATTTEAAGSMVPTSEPPAREAEAPAVSSQIQVSGPYVTATIDKEKQTQEITLPRVDYGDDKEARALMRQENARIEEVEVPAADERGPSLRIAQIDDAAKVVEPPLMTPTTKEQVERAVHSAVQKHILNRPAMQDDWKRILIENQRISQHTTMNILKMKILGIPQVVSSEQPLWLEERDKQAEQTKAQLFGQLLDRKKRLNQKIETLKQRYRSINEEWKLHCSRLDRAAERREMLRRPHVSTPAGTPGGFGAEEPSTGAAGGGVLGASLTTSRTNRRNAQTGFAGFGDAVRSEAEFLEILASLETADMQDPNMRAARTTATAPDMHINPESDHLMKLPFDDINGYVADPLAFYLDEFDPDVWSEEEKAIFARRYALWPKQFGKIAQALPHKTPSQCVRYYYLSKKLAGNDFKALAAARNRERKRKARGKPKKAKGSALMADLKSAKGEEADDVEDGSGIRSPTDLTDPSLVQVDAPVSSNGRRGGRSRMLPAGLEGGSAVVAEDMSAGRKRPADRNESETGSIEPREKRKGPKSKRAKSDSASAADKPRKPRNSLKKDSGVLDGANMDVPSIPAIPSSGPKIEATDAPAPGGSTSEVSGPAAAADPTEEKARVEDSDLAAAEALGALAGLFNGTAPGDANSAASAAPPSGSDAASLQQLSSEQDPDGRKVGKKRRSKTAGPGEEGGEGAGRGRGKQPTSSYWSVAERSEFLRALVVHGPRWEVVSSTLAQKSAAQARNYFARNENEVDFAEAAALARSHTDLPQAEREVAALAFVRQRFASNAAVAPPSHSQAGGPMAVSTMSVSGFANEAASRATHLPRPPGLTSGQGDVADVEMRDEPPEPPVQRRGLQIDSLLNDTNDAASSRAQRRSSLHEWPAEREQTSHAPVGRDVSMPPGLHARQVPERDQRPLTADRIQTARPLSSENRSIRDGHGERANTYEGVESHRAVADGRELREGSGDSRSWMYDPPYEAHRRPSPSPGYAAMAPPSHPVERGMPASRYSMPPGSVSGAGHMARSVSSMTSHLHDEAQVERERAGYGMYGSAGRSREPESHSMPPGDLRHSASGEEISPTSASFGATHGYSRYASPGVASMYPSPAAASTALAARGRPSSGPLTAALSSTNDRPAYEQRWQRYSQSPGPSTSLAPSASASHGPSAVGGFSTGSAYRSSSSPYSSFPSQSLPRPSLPSLSASSGKAGAPHLPSLGAAGRSLPPILGTFPAPGRGMAPGARPAGTGEEARYWPYPPRPRGHDQPSNRTPE